MPNAKSSNRDRKRRQQDQGRRSRKACIICTQHDGKVDYKDLALLRRFMSDRAKIRSSRVTGTCPQHQRKISVAIKNARELALLPYTNR